MLAASKHPSHYVLALQLLWPHCCLRFAGPCSSAKTRTWAPKEGDWTQTEPGEPGHHMTELSCLRVQMPEDDRNVRVARRWRKKWQGFHLSSPTWSLLSTSSFRLWTRPSKLPPKQFALGLPTLGQNLGFTCFHRSPTASS